MILDEMCSIYRWKLQQAGTSDCGAEHEGGDSPYLFPTVAQRGSARQSSL